MNVGSWLEQTAAATPDNLAIVAPDGAGWKTLTFAALNQEVARIAHGLVAAGWQRGDRTLLMVKPGIDLIAITQALFRIGAVPVIIDPGMGRAGFLSCIAQVQPSALIGIPLAHVVRLLFPSSFRSVKRWLTVGTRWLWGGPSLASLPATSQPYPALDVADAELAAILFTSGSTGPAKGAVYSHGIFNAQVRMLRDIFGFQAGEVDLAAFPLFSLFDAALGMTSVIPDIDASKPAACNPAKVVDALTRWKCTTASGSPAVWRKVGPWCAANNQKLPGLRRIITFGAPIPPAMHATFRQVLDPGAGVYTPYGATEALPVALIDSATILGETAEKTAAGAGTCVGPPDPAVEVRILAITDAPIATMADATVLAPGQIGEITVRSPSVTTAYFELPEATAKAKISDNGTIWHRMGDLGYLDGAGRLWFCGRKVERVETAAGPLFTDCVEGVFNAWPEISRCALVGTGPPGAQEPALIIEGQPDNGLAERVLATGKVRRVLFHPAFPVDPRHNSKIHRLQLGKWAETQTAMTRR